MASHEPITLGEIARTMDRIEIAEKANRQRAHELSVSLNNFAVEQGKLSAKLDAVREDMIEVKTAQTTGRNIILGGVAAILVNIIATALVLIGNG